MTSGPHGDQDTLRSQCVEAASCAAVAEQEEAGRVHRPPSAGDHVSDFFQNHFFRVECAGAWSLIAIHSWEHLLRGRAGVWSL